ncbi:MAG: hypothetical protein ACLFPQ_03360 [Candidatus Woesearchaeota archaeon]
MLDKLLNTKEHQRRLLEDIVESQKIIKDDLEIAKAKVSYDTIQERYRQCCNEKDQKTARKIAKLFEVQPESGILEKAIKTETCTHIPVEFELPYNSKTKLFKENVREIDDILRQYKIFMSLNRYFPEQIKSGVDLCRAVIKNYMIQPATDTQDKSLSTEI